MYRQWTPIEVRERVVQLYLSVLSFSEIGKRSGVSKQTAFNIVKKYLKTDSVIPDKSSWTSVKKLTENVLDHIGYYKSVKPSIYLHEIRQKLLVDIAATRDFTSDN